MTCTSVKDLFRQTKLDGCALVTTLHPAIIYKEGTWPRPENTGKVLENQ